MEEDGTVVDGRSPRPGSRGCHTSDPVWGTSVTPVVGPQGSSRVPGTVSFPLCPGVVSDRPETPRSE